MRTSPTTSESAFRTVLLDALRAQWRALGVPLSTTLDSESLEVIDPEELLWCSLEFFESDPRLAEGVRGWMEGNRHRLNRQRLTRLANGAHGDARAARWRQIDERRGTAAARAPSHGKSIGSQSRMASTLLLRARDLLGNDSRSFLLVQLLGSERGIRLRHVADASGYSYRSVWEAASGWQRAGVVRVDRGHCVLLRPAPWHELLGSHPEEVVTVDWHAAYGATVDLLRLQANAESHGFAADHPLAHSAAETADVALQLAAAGIDPRRSPVVTALREVLSGPR